MSLSFPRRCNSPYFLIDWIKAQFVRFVLSEPETEQRLEPAVALARHIASLMDGFKGNKTYSIFHSHVGLSLCEIEVNIFICIRFQRFQGCKFVYQNCTLIRKKNCIFTLKVLFITLFITTFVWLLVNYLDVIG